MKNLVLIILFLILLVGFPSFIASNHPEADPIFSVKILDFQSPVKLGEFMKFSYSTEGISGIDGSSEISFWIERGGKTLTSGSDTIFLGKLGEEERMTKIFLPSDFESGVYTLRLEADYNGHIQKAHRTIEINIENGFAVVDLGFGETNIIIIIILVMLAILNIFLVWCLEKKKIKKVLEEEEKFIKKHRVSILTTTFFLILGGLVYYLNVINSLPGISVYYYYLILVVLFVVVLFFTRFKKK